MVLSTLLSCTPPPVPVSPLAQSWNRQASGVSSGVQVLSDSLAAAATPIALPATVLPELRGMHPMVGLEDSTRALFRAPMGPGSTGYILRLPSTEGPYLALTVYREAEGSWARPLIIAQSYGDAGFSWEGRSWLVDLNDDGYFEIVSRWHTSDFDPEREGQPPMVTDSLAVLRLERGHMQVSPAGPGDPLWERFRLPTDPR